MHGYKVAKVGKIWTDPRIREILLNEVYIGNMVQGRMKKINYKSKKNIRLPKEEWKIIKNTHEPIIDNETFSKARSMLETRKQTRVKTHDYLLKGIVYCHKCKKKMGVSPRKLKEGNVYYFRCSTYTSYARLKVCTPNSIRMDYVESIVLDKIRDILVNFTRNNNLMDIARKKFLKKRINKTYTNELEEYKLKLSKCILEIDSIYNDRLNNILTDDDFTRIYKNKTQEKTQVQNKITMIESYMNDNSIDENEIICKLVENFKNPINRKILTDLIDRIEIDEDKKIYIFFKFKMKKC